MPARHHRLRSLQCLRAAGDADRFAGSVEGRWRVDAVGGEDIDDQAPYCRAGTRTPTTRARIWRAANYTTRQGAAASIALGFSAQGAADDVQVDGFEALGDLDTDRPGEVEQLEVQHGGSRPAC